MADFNHFKTVYFEECNELLNSAEENLLELQSGNHDSEIVNAIFRAIHSIKGGAGSFGFNNLIDFAHLYETILDALRNNKINLNNELCDALLKANDVLSDLVKSANLESEETPVQLYNVKALLADILDNIHPTAVRKTAATHLENKNIYETLFNIQFKPKKELMRYGNEPKFILQELASLKLNNDNSHFSVTVSLENLPDFTDLDWEICYLHWTIALRTTADIKRIKEAFEFVEDDCTLEIDVKEQILIKKNTDIAEGFLKDTPNNQSKPIDTSQKEEVGHTIRVELDRIDRLVNTVGEMVIKQAMLVDQVQSTNMMAATGIGKSLQELSHHIRDLQEYVMAIRAQPVKTVFQRMPRLVREVSASLKKDVHLEMFGENTEIDKTVIERLGEPLMHMLRNAIDHGIESAQKRIQQGKNPYGTIRLSAEHKSGRIVIMMEDDGAGINREKVLQKAIAQGIVSSDNSLTGEDIDSLIFHPGFSTADSITNISGRGVGMDVVKKSIQSLGGRVSIQSTEGKGCKFILTLPLTLAVLDGMIVSCANHLYIIPIINIIETLRPNSDQISALVGCHDILNLRNNTMPMVYLHEIFNIPDSIHNPCDAIVVVVESEGGELLGLVVDNLLKQQQVVIKSLEENYDPIFGISGATILGNGNVAMILDISALRTLGQQQITTRHDSFDLKKQEGDKHGI